MSVQFETPENVTIQYQTAGLGSRFMAFFFDSLFLLIPYLLIVLAIIGILMLQDKHFDEIVRNSGREDQTSLLLLLLLVIFTVWGVLNVAYFAVCELFLHGQTPGKRIMKLRVVKAAGFSLDASSVVIRSVFRVLDNFPPVWVLLYFHPRNQRLGDLAAKTLVVYDVPPDLTLQDMKEKLLSRERTAPRFSFNAVLAGRTPWESVLAAEKLLLRWPEMSAAQQERFLRDFCTPLAGRHQLPVPDLDSAPLFLEEYLILRYRQQYRQLG